MQSKSIIAHITHLVIKSHQYNTIQYKIHLLPLVTFW